MSQRDLSAEKLKEIHDLAAGWGKIIARRVFGESAPTRRSISRRWSKSPPLPLAA